MVVGEGGELSGGGSGGAITFCCSGSFCVGFLAKTFFLGKKSPMSRIGQL